MEKKVYQHNNLTSADLRTEILKRESCKKATTVSQTQRAAEIEACSKYICEAIRFKLYNADILDVYYPGFLRPKKTDKRAVFGHFCYLFICGCSKMEVRSDREEIYDLVCVYDKSDISKILKNINAYCEQNKILVFNQHCYDNYGHTNNGAIRSDNKIIMNKTPDKNITISKDLKIDCSLVLNI